MSDKKTIMEYKIAAFYLFIPIEDPAELKAVLAPLCTKLKGSILIAPEGINSTISGCEEDIDDFLAFLKQKFPEIVWKISFAPFMPFTRMLIKIKKEIVALKQDAKTHLHTGVKLNFKQWNEMIKNPDILVLDVRNNYEIQDGTFHNATDPNTEKFSEFVDYINRNLADKKDKKIAMFCTGGIRCEKASAYMLENGFSEIYQLDGGILKYLEETPEEESLWKGKCFVFDHRITVNHQLSPQNTKNYSKANPHDQRY